MSAIISPGIDKDTAFTSRHVSDKELAGDADLFSMIQTPDTKCARLAQATDGSFFSMDKLVAGRVRFQKHFVDVFSRRVAKSAVVPGCQVCECEADANGAARSVCKPCTGAPVVQPVGTYIVFSSAVLYLYDTVNVEMGEKITNRTRIPSIG